MKPVYVIGHKNPDVDSVASAIAYKVFKQSTDEGLYIAAAPGELRDETRFILEQLEFEPPIFLKHVGTTVDDLLDEDEMLYITPDMTLVELSNLMRQHKLKTVPVLDDKKGFLGLLTIGDVAMVFMEELGQGKDIENSPDKLRRILETRVTDLMKTRDLVLFVKDEPVQEARTQMLATRFRNYPVVDENNRFLGMISRYNLLQMKRKRLILVDHNEKKQAVDGVEEAEILEIVDHHRVGDLETIVPIFFHNEPVGSTSTLVAERFLNNGMYMGHNLAGLLLSGLITDTMIFKSPTTTAKDRRIAGELSRLSGLDPLDWGKQVFDQAVNLERHSDEELIEEDLKEYQGGNTVFAISQVETVDLKRFSQRRQGILKTMGQMCQQRNYAFMCLMVTDILEEGTELLIAGERSSLAEKAFGISGVEGSAFLQGVMSRKKQVVPVIYEVLRQETMG